MRCVALRLRASSLGQQRLALLTKEVNKRRQLDPGQHPDTMYTHLLPEGSSLKVVVLHAQKSGTLRRDDESYATSAERHAVPCTQTSAPILLQV